MYRKQQKSIIKHMDFLILDILMLIISYIAATIIRDGWHSLRANAAFLTMLGVLILLQVMVALQGNNYNDILRRGYLVELKCVLIQNAIVLAAAFTFMFITKSQPKYSRLVFGYLLIINTLLTYGAHLIWKRVVRGRMVNSKERTHLLVISEYAGLEACIRRLQSEWYKEYKITGVVVYDRQMKGDVINNISVVADMDELFQYLKKEVVDEVFLNIDGNNQERLTITEDLLEMGITVHININMDLGQGQLPNPIVHNMSGCAVLTTSIKTATFYQMVAKRMMDIAGGDSRPDSDGIPVYHICADHIDVV